MSVTVDYQDHWSYFDKSISVYNFLIYEENEWEKFNPNRHYQNRLRHCDYIRIFKETGFDIKQINIPNIESEDRNNLRNIKKASCFSQYTEEELLIRRAHFILLKN